MKKSRFKKKTVKQCLSLIIIILSHSFSYSQTTKEWETKSVFLAPESIVFDSLNNCLYVSNFNDKGGFRKNDDKYRDECISKIDVNGKILEFKWIDSLLGPTGLAIKNNRLFIVERDGISIARIEDKKIESTIFIDGAGFLNDIVIDENGIIYISDSNNNCIYEIDNGKSEVWFSDTILNTSNGLFIDNNKLIVGNRGSANLISISLTNKSVEIIARDLSDNIDGIKKKDENYILSWRSELFILESNNKKKVLFESENNKDFLADFEFINDRNLLVIPRLLTNSIIALKLNYPF